MTDRKHDPLVPSAASRPGALAKRPPGDLVARGLADLEALRQAMPDAEECFQRGERLYGEGNHAEAVIWYRRAAEQGHASAQYNLGWMYANDRGVAQDDVTAYTWFSLAASGASGNLLDPCVNLRDRAAERLTPDQLAEADRWVREWDAAHPREPPCTPCPPGVGSMPQYKKLSM